MAQQIERRTLLTADNILYEIFCGDRRTFNNAIRQINTHLESPRPDRVCSTGILLESVIEYIGNQTLNKVASPNSLVLPRYQRIIDLQDKYFDRIDLAKALEIPHDELTTIQLLIERLARIQRAGDEFKLAPENVEQRLIAASKSPILFWNPSDLKADEIGTARQLVDNVSQMDSLPQEVRNTIQEKLKAEMQKLTQSLTADANRDWDADTTQIYERLVFLKSGKRILTSLDAPNENISQYYQHIIANLHEKGLIDLIRKKPHTYQNRKCLCVLADILDTPDNIKKYFTELGINQEDLEVFFAVSLFDKDTAIRFAQIAINTDPSLQEQYSELVIDTLQLFYNDDDEKIMDYRGNKTSLPKPHIWIAQDIENIAIICQTVGMPVDNYQLQQTVNKLILDKQSRIASMKDNETKQKILQQIKEIKQTAVQLGIFPNADAISGSPSDNSH